jgi:RNA polymerase sporulation-specific sigma factor
MEELIRRFTPFVVKTARGIYVKGYELMDLIQIGKISIIKAVSMFDINKGNGFTSYVTNAIKRTLYTLIRDNIKKTSYCSLNSLNSEGIEIIDCIASEENFEEQIIEDEEKATLNRALKNLLEKERDIIYWFYFENKTLEQYAKEKGIAYRTVLDRKRRALAKLKSMLGEKD